jgi:hypothetical protein
MTLTDVRVRVYRVADQAAQADANGDDPEDPQETEDGHAEPGARTVFDVDREGVGQRHVRECPTRSLNRFLLTRC